MRILLQGFVRPHLGKPLFEVVGKMRHDLPGSPFFMELGACWDPLDASLPFLLLSALGGIYPSSRKTEAQVARASIGVLSETLLAPGSSLREVLAR